MKETYDIIIGKLERDVKSFNFEIQDIIDRVEENELYRARYERLTGAKNYARDLISFFKEVRSNLK